MEAAVHYGVSERNKKRKLAADYQINESLRFPLDELNQDVLEQVLSWLPASNFFRYTSVCKRWKSVGNSATFKLACSQIPSREPWYFMVDSQAQFKNQPIVFDTAENNWKKLNFPLPLLQEEQRGRSFVPVAASGGLLCFLSSPPADEFIICNPLTGACKEIVSLNPELKKSKILRGIGMISSPESYSLVLVFGDLSELSIRVYNSSIQQWEEETMLKRKHASPADETEESEDDHAVYFLSKCGNVVSTNLQRSPCKQYSSVITQKNGEKFMHFLSSSGTIVACNLTKKCFFEYPRLLPVYHEYSIDLVECGGDVYVVLLMEFLESASLRVWRFDEKDQSWHQIAAMPPAMSHGFYGKRVDINCAGAGQQILVCLNSAEVCSYFLCHLMVNEWIEVPKYHINGDAKDFICAFTFEPRIEASV
ncbi:unnamed protein product [Coffea canephora]|uniref:F-box domain-containing protein n=1 Tax=Coffea canephora TaxID=49390 RepID=A0A068VAX1_COFCA|nr:unnamed protein product [Coffea canephora]